MRNDFEKMLESIDLELTDVQFTKFQEYYNTLVEWNGKMNLTAITDERDVFMKHFFDSIYLSKVIDLENQTILDVGSGAGFPSIPLKIMFPNLKVTIIDALNKRIVFLTNLCEKLNIEVELIHGRAEEYKRKHCFDLVTARAVANLNMLSELCIPFAKLNGMFLAMKGPKLVDELETSKTAIKTLGGEVREDYKYELFGQERHILIVDKVNKTKKEFPRKFSKIKNNPL